MNAIVVISQNYLGFLADVTQLLEDNEINILGIDARNYGDMAKLSITTCNNDNALNILMAQGYRAYPKQTLWIRIPNQPGFLAKVSRSLVDSEIDLRQLRHISHDDKDMVVELTTSDDAKASAILSKWVVEH